ncbi:MAG: hypothetical protein IPI67_28575 [Myxococcales bacterium]|nr:hypothetical protein [Myxococcales bacterium]
MPSKRTLLALSLPLFLVTGCPDAEGQYDEFKDRFTELHPGSGGASGAAGAAGSPGDASVCTAPAPGEIDGEYLFTLAAVLDSSKPILFLAKVTTEDKGGATAMRWNLQGLLWSDRKTLVGTPFDIPAAGDSFALGADGTFDAKLPPLSVVGEANPFSHSPITAEVTLKGKFCGAQTVFCGIAEGDVTKPVPIPLGGSTWTLEKAPAGAFPEPPKLNCKSQLATPLCCVDVPATCGDEAAAVTAHCADPKACCKPNAAKCTDVLGC